MGFVGKVLGNVTDIQLYYIVGLLIFMSLFVVIIIRTVRMKKTDIIEIKNSILQDSITQDTNLKG